MFQFLNLELIRVPIFSDCKMETLFNSIHCGIILQELKQWIGTNRIDTWIPLVGFIFFWTLSCNRFNLSWSSFKCFVFIFCLFFTGLASKLLCRLLALLFTGFVSGSLCESLSLQLSRFFLHLLGRFVTWTFVEHKATTFFRFSTFLALFFSEVLCWQQTHEKKC